MSKNGWMRAAFGEIQAAAGDQIAAAFELDLAAIDLRVAEQHRPIERAAQGQIGAGDDARLIVVDAQRAGRDQPHVEAHVRRRPRPVLRPTAPAPRRRSSPLKRPPDAPKPRAQLALFTFTVPVTIGAVAGPCSASSASTIERMPSG